MEGEAAVVHSIASGNQSNTNWPLKKLQLQRPAPNLSLIIPF